MSSPSLQHSRPKLRPGVTYVPNKQHLVFELAGGTEQVVLPADATRLLELLDGRRTVSEIIQQLFVLEGHAPFRLLFATLASLQKQGCLDGADALLNYKPGQTSEVFERTPIWLTRPILSVPLLSSKPIGRPSVVAFTGAAVIVLGIALNFFYQAWKTGTYAAPSGFLYVDESYSKGIILFFIAASALTSLAGLTKAFLSTLLTGVRAPLRLEFNLFSLGLRTHDEKLYAAGGKTFGTLAVIAVSCSHYFVFAAASIAFPNFRHLESLFWISTVLALIDLNPFRRSDLTSYFNAIFNSASSEGRAIDLFPYFRNRGLLAPLQQQETLKHSSIYMAYTILAIGWTMVAYNITLALLTRNDSLLIATALRSARDGVWAEAIAALLIFLSIAVSLFYIVGDLAYSFYKNVVHPVRSQTLKRISIKRQRVNAIDDAESIADLLSELPLFSGVQRDALLFLLGRSTVRSVPKGVRIVVQDTASDELYVLLAGAAAVIRREPTGADVELAKLKAPAVFGENTLLDNTPRSADVAAAGDCRILAIPRAAIDEFHTLTRHNPTFTRDFEQLVDRLAIGQYLSSSELFRDCPKEASSLFLSDGTVVNVPPGRHVIEQGRTDRDFYLVLRGSVDVIRDGSIIKTLSQGDFFGEMATILNSPRTATVITREASRFLKLSAAEFWQALTLNAGLAIYLETVTELRQGEAT